MGKMKTTDYGNSETILKFVDHYVNVSEQIPVALGVKVDGRTIVKAGTIFPANDATATGVVFQDYDVADGDANGAVLVHGFVDLTKLPEVPTAEAKAALTQITFL